MNLQELNNFLLELDNKYDINSGACALVASMIAKYCEDHNIEYKTKVYVDHRDYSCIWHWSIIIEDIEINSSTYEYQEWEEEKYFIEDTWNSKNLKERYDLILSEYNYWRRKNESIVKKLIEDSLNILEI